MNKNKMLNDKPIFVAKRRIFRGLILSAMCLMLALVLYLLVQEQEYYKLKEVVGWFGVVLFGVGGVGVLYITLMFKKIMLFDDRIEVHFGNKVRARRYSQIKSCYVFERGMWPSIKGLVLECEPKFRHSNISNTFLHKNDLYKIKEILIKKGVKDDDWI